jgi:hypothetical protein
MPAGMVGLRAWARYRGEAYQPVGCGFFLRTDEGKVVGVTTAHSLTIGDPARPLERVALGVTGSEALVGEYDKLWGLPGQRFSGEDLTVDYALLVVDGPMVAELVLNPDPRGGPQPGEVVWLVSGLGDGQGGRRMVAGRVQSAGDGAFWVVMDEKFDPSGMSGSPLVSQHTGRAVGMAVASSPRRNGLLVGAHPIGSLVRKAETADGWLWLPELEAVP